MLDLFMWIIGQHTKTSEDEVRGPSSHLTWNDPVQAANLNLF